MLHRCVFSAKWELNKTIIILYQIEHIEIIFLHPILGHNEALIAIPHWSSAISCASSKYQ